MKNRCLMTLLATTLILGLCATPALSQQAGAPPVAKKKRARKPVAACDLYTRFIFMTGWFRDPDYYTGGRFSREGMAPGAACFYRPRGRLSIGVGGDFYIGNLSFDLSNDEFEGSFSYLEGGFKEWVKIALNSHSAQISLAAGVQKNGNRRIDVRHLEVQLIGSSFDVTDFAGLHMKNTGNLEIWEAGLETRFPFGKKTALTFGLQWQRYNISTHTELDVEGYNTLSALNIDPDRINLSYQDFADFFYLTPGIERCGKHFCASASVPWAVFREEVGSWGIQTKIGYRF